MNRQLTYDVVIAGGGPAGVAAAIGAATSGAKTLLLERNPYLGGQATHSNVTAFCGFHSRGNPPVQVVAGAGETLLQKLRTLGEDTSCWVSPSTGNASIRFNPEMLKLAMDMVVEDAGADLLLHARIIGAAVEDGRIAQIECVDDAGRFGVRARAFVDATGDANLAFLSGGETLWGDERGAVQQAGLVARIDRILPDADTTPAAMAKAVAAAREAGIAPLPKEKGFMIRVGGADTGYCTLPSATIGNMDARTLTKAEISMRRQAHAYVRALREHLPGMAGCRLVSTGPRMGLRESRRIAGDEILTARDVLESRKVSEPIARGGWSPEIHADNSVTYSHLEDRAWFDVPIGAIKARSLKNLWCGGRNISCESLALASVRVMGTGLATGHGAGVAAAMTLDRDEFDYEQIRAELEKQGALLQETAGPAATGGH